MKTPLSYKITDKLFLVRQTVSKQLAPAKPVEVPTNHVLVIDCSGSMSWDLPKIREQVKKKLPKLLKKEDTVSVIWFSGRGQFGTLLEAEPVASLSDLKEVEKAVDRWLSPVGMTGFKEPLEEAEKVATRIAKKNSNAFSLFFMSDGCDNQWGRGEILKAVEKVSGRLASATFVEYGYYADRNLLTQMAEKAGGSLIFAEDFDRYQPAFEAAMQKKTSGAKRIEVSISGDTIGGFAFAVTGGDLVTFGVEKGKIAVPEDLAEVCYLSPTIQGLEEADLGTAFGPKATYNSDETVTATYAAISLFAIRMKSDVVFPLLKATGDVKFIESFSTCFGKQKYSEFMDAAKTAAFDSKVRFEKGYDPKRVPKDDAFTVLDFLNTIQSDDSVRVVMDHPSFKYSRIGRGRVDASDQLTDAEQAEIDQLTNDMKATKDAKKIKELADKIATISASKKSALVFTADPAPEGYSIDGLTFNEDRPNVSFRIRRPGTVDLSDRLPDQFKGKKLGSIPEKFQTFQYRNYTVIKDGLVNIENFPVRLSQECFDKLVKAGMPQEAVIEKTAESGTIFAVINLRTLPVINRQMVKTTSAKSLFEKKYELAKGKAAQKVYNAYVDEKLPPKKSEGFTALYGDDGATWLKEQGVTDYSGYQPPKTTQAAATDKYTAKELKVSLKGLSSLPKVAEVRDKIAAKGKLNAGGALMVDAINDVESFLKSDFYTKAGDKDKVLSTWLKDRQKATTNACRQLMFEIAQTTFTTVVGQVWFQEFSSLDENTLTLDIDGQKIEGKVEMKEFEVEI